MRESRIHHPTKNIQGALQNAKILDAYNQAYSIKIIFKTILKWKGCHHQNIVNDNAYDDLLTIQEAMTKSHQLLIMSLSSPRRKLR